MANEFKVKKGLIAYGSGSVVLDIQGSQGQLMSVTDSPSTTLFSVKNLSGTERFAVSASGDIKMPNLTTTNQSNVVTIDTSTGLLYYTASSAIGGGGSSVLTSQLAANTTVGGIPSGSTYAVGTTLESLFRAMLITYRPPTISSLTTYLSTRPVIGPGTTYLEVDSSAQLDNIVFSAVADSPNGRFAYSASFTASGADTNNFTYYLGNNVLGTSNTLSVPSTNPSRSTPGTITFTVNAKNPQTGAGISPTICSAVYVYPYFYGMSAVDYSTTGNLSGDVNLTRLSEPAGTKLLPIVGSLKYVYFAYPASYGDLTSIKDGNGFELLPGGMTKYTRIQARAGSWSGISYNIYRSSTLTTVSSQTYTFTL